MIKQARTNDANHLFVARQIRNDYLARLCTQIGQRLITPVLQVGQWCRNRHRLPVGKR